LNILLLDDEKNELDALADIVTASGHSVRAFTDAEELISFHTENPVAADAAILDILLAGQDLNGIDTAGALRERGFPGPVVFLSSSREYGPETYKVSAAGYLIKPVTKENAAEALHILGSSVAAIKAKDDAYIMVRSAGGLRKIFLCDLLYVEATGNKLNFHLSGGEIFTVRTALKDYEQELLADERFARSHRAFIVNLTYVSSVRGTVATMLDGSQVYVAKTHTKFKEAFILSRLRGETP
jgi:DNA-binding LytR/AlgR family response regulator